MDIAELECDGVRMRYAASGKGEPVLLVHGFGSSLEVWTMTRERIDPHYRVVAMDLPGFGKSTKVALESLEGFTGCLAHLMDHLGLPAAHVVGHSFGGGIAMGFALQYPQRVRSLVLLASAGLGPTGESGFRGMMAAARSRDEVLEVLRLVFHDPAMISDGMIERLHAFKNEQGVVEALTRLVVVRTGWELMTERRVDELAMPILVAWGRHDVVAPPENAQRLRHLPNAQFWMAEDCAHLPQVEACDMFCARLLEFLRTVRAR